MSKNLKNISFILLLFLGSLLFYQVVSAKASSTKEIPYSKFLQFVEQKRIFTGAEPEKTLLIQGDIIKGYYKDPAVPEKETAFTTYVAYSDKDLISLLKKNKISFRGIPREESFFWRSITYILPWILIIGFFWMMLMRQLQSTGNRALSFGKSRARLNTDNKKKVTFKDVAGVEEAKEELKEVVSFLKDPKKFETIGAKIPKGVLLVGSPGTGKTLLARACAGEADVPFFSISGSDFVEMFVGVGASRVRDMFQQAKKELPCIVFIDEIDAVGRLRGAGLGGGHDEREQTLNQLLVEMDGFEDNAGIILLAATNRPDVLDPALLRPGRFDRQIVVDTPDVKGRMRILEIHSAKVPLAGEVSLDSVARGTPGFTGADLANVINEAALLAARKNKKKVFQNDIEEARDKVMMGPERKSFFISDEERKIIAYHEGGHALLSAVLENTEPVHKVTIVPRGRALGLTQQLPDQERHMKSKKFWLDEIIVLMGGRLAENIQFKDITTGASNDIERATSIARKMVTEWGMSNTIGPIHLSGNDSNSVFLGRDYAKNTEHSDEYARIVDAEVKKIIDNAAKKGEQLLKKHKLALDKIANALLKKEVITGDEVREFIFGKEKPAPAKSVVKKEKKKNKEPSVKPKQQIIGGLGIQPA